MQKIIPFATNYLKQLFSLDDDKEDEKLITESISQSVNFKGTNSWTLVFAILIASIGLNVNSTAVIIGAMLISPLMGPIMGIGLGVAIYDFRLLQRGSKNLLVAAVISITTSYLYFLVTPLQGAGSELLSRTTPTIWDVFIAFLGGLSGIVAGTRKEKSNVLPGVAIATALMPPLCTAGYGLATGHYIYFFGALYLFFINSVFICVATLLIVRFLKFKKIEFPSYAQRKKEVRTILLLVFLTVVPSIYIAWEIVSRTIFEENAKQFVQKEFHFAQTQVVNKFFIYDRKLSTIELLLIGAELPSSKIDSLTKKLPEYKLNHCTLIVRQGLDAKQNIDLAQIKASILEDVFAVENRKDTVERQRSGLEQQIPDLQSEFKSLYPDLSNFALSRAVFLHLDTLRYDTVLLCVMHFRKPVIQADRSKLRNWLKARLSSDSVKLVFE